MHILVQICFGVHNLSFGPLASGSSRPLFGETRVDISMGHGPSWLSSTLSVCLALAGTRTGCGSEAETFISLPSTEKMYRLPMFSNNNPIHAQGQAFEKTRNPALP